MKGAKQIRMALIEKAGEDEDFRARLLSDAKSTIESEFDITVPEGFNLHVHEEDPGTAHIVLPPNPGLSTQELASVSGAVSYDDDYGQFMDGD